MLFAQMPCATSVIVRLDVETAGALVDALRDLMLEGKRRAINNIILDSSGISHYVHQGLDAHLMLQESRARVTAVRIMLYCADAARAGIPLNSIESINDNKGIFLPQAGDGVEVDWREVYEHLETGFIYNGILYNADTGATGVPIESTLRDT